MNTAIHSERIPCSPGADAYDSTMLAQRASRFDNCLKRFVESKGEAWAHNTPRCWAADMLADLLHWCDVNDLDFEDMLTLAKGHHRFERDDDLKVSSVGVVQSLQPITPH